MTRTASISWIFRTHFIVFLFVFMFTAPAVAEIKPTPKVRATLDLAERLGYPAERLQPEIDLVSDLHLDRLTIHEAIVTLCDDWHVEHPSSELTRVEQIVAWLVEEAPPQIVLRGPTRKDEVVAVQRVYFATNRHRTKAVTVEEMFDGNRSEPGQTTLGYADISIPPGHREGHIETPLLNRRALLDPGNHFIIQRLHLHDEKVFFQKISALLGKHEQLQDGIVVFIHGYNMTFTNALLRTAQLAYDSGFKGVPIAFSWPSDGKFLAYNHDREDATWSIQYIEDFLRSLRRKMPERKIHLIAHSMGSQGLLGALHHLALKNEAKTRFDSVILAAPDFDAGYFQQQIGPRIRHLANRWAIYASDKDAALDFSSTLNAMKRLGQPLTLIDGMEMVDATGLEVTPWNVPQSHSYYATKKRIIDDMLGFFRGHSPKQRQLIARLSDGHTYWSLGAVPK